MSGLWLSIVAATLYLLRWVASQFSAEAELGRRKTAEAEQKGRIAVEQERLDAAYRRIDKEPKATPEENLARLRAYFRSKDRQR